MVINSNWTLKHKHSEFLCSDDILNLFLSQKQNTLFEQTLNHLFQARKMRKTSLMKNKFFWLLNDYWLWKDLWSFSVASAASRIRLTSNTRYLPVSVLPLHSPVLIWTQHKMFKAGSITSSLENFSWLQHVIFFN